jgi:hypothetical protein
VAGLIKSYILAQQANTKPKIDGNKMAK